MTEKESMSGGAVWRRRVLASAGVAAVVCAGSVALASSANAAGTAPKLTITAPAKLANSGSSSLLTIEVDNSASGNDTIPPAGTAEVLGVNVTIPVGLNCNLVTFAPNNAGSTPAGAQGTQPALTYSATLSSGNNCAFFGTITQPKNSDYVYGYNFSVAALPGQTGSTGTITTQPFLDTYNGIDFTLVTTGNTASTTLGNVAAPAVGTAPPAATIYQSYSATVFSDTGTPSTPAVGVSTLSGAGTTASPFTATPGYRVFQANTDKESDGTYAAAGGYLPATTVPNDSSYGAAQGDAAFFLEGSGYAENDCFYFDTVTAKIINGDGNCDQPATTTDATPEFTYTIIANNGHLGLSSPGTSGIAAGSTARPTPDLAVGDVATPAFTLPVLFSDVTVGSTFGKDIYSLSDTGAIKGFADGTYRPGLAVTRAEFVNILVGYDPNNVFSPITGSGECSTIEPSAFSDVPNSSIFCEAIKTLSQFHVINGTGNGKFSPNAPIKRQEMAALLYRFSSVEKTGNVLNGDATFTPPSPFSDVSATNVFAGDIEWAAKNGIAKGYSDGTFRPLASTTRDATAALINRTGLGL